MKIVRGEGKRKPIQWTIPIEPIEYNPKEVKGTVATFDTETDPFAVGRIVKPFTCGFYVPSLDYYKDFWGDDCIDQFFVWIAEETAKGGDLEGMVFTIFVHNGGNFDFYFLLDHFDEGHKPFIINGRLVRIEAGNQTFRDSYAMIPVSLGTYQKDTIDYRCMERGFRDVFKDKILHYQKMDCIYLSELVVAWLEMFGDKMTMASVALPMLRSYQGFETFTEKTDLELRPYYFGGRNQCFGTGELKGDFKVYDINSSYPDVMRRFEHPISDTPIYGKSIGAKTHFVHLRAWSLGALPIRAPSGSLSFPIGTFDFFANMHEVRVGLELGILKIQKIYQTIDFETSANFSEFIDRFYALRIQAKADKDAIKDLFYKLVMNSSYGKFAQDPRKYENYLFDPEVIPKPDFCADCFGLIKQGKVANDNCETCGGEQPSTSPYGWYLHTTTKGQSIFASPQKLRGGSFFNVATAASITSAARASLLRGIHAATRPVYCDTDSVICEHLEATDTNGIILDGKKLGAWDTEARGDTVAIAGKKLYAVFNEGQEIKKASKGVKLTAEEILRVCRGEVIEYASPVPKFKLDGNHQWINRKIRATG